MMDIDPNIDPALFLASSSPPPASTSIASASASTSTPDPAIVSASIPNPTGSIQVPDLVPADQISTPAAQIPNAVASTQNGNIFSNKSTTQSLPNGFDKSPDIAVPSALPDVNDSVGTGNIAVPSISGSTSASAPVTAQQQTQKHPSSTSTNNAGVKRKQEEPVPFTKCPYRERRNCKKEYKHINNMRYHLEQAHSQEADIQATMAQFPAPPPSKKTKTSHAKAASSVSTANTHNHNNNRNHTPNNHSSQSQQQNRVSSQPAQPITGPNPFFGLFTHGYVFSSAGLPFRPHDRPIDALYYLNIMSTAGIKSQQQRASERLMINALLNADFVRSLQSSVNMQQQLGHIVHPLDLLDNLSMLKKPERPVQPSAQWGLSPYSKRDADSAILKLAKTLQDVGLGDSIDNAHYF